MVYEAPQVVLDEQDCGEQKWIDLLATEQVIDLQLAFLLGLVKASVWESAQPLLRADAEQQDQAGPQ